MSLSMLQKYHHQAVLSDKTQLYWYQKKHSMLIKQLMYGKILLVKSLLLELNWIMILKRQPKKMHLVVATIG